MATSTNERWPRGLTASSAIVAVAAVLGFAGTAPAGASVHRHQAVVASTTIAEAPIVSVGRSLGWTPLILLVLLWLGRSVVLAMLHAWQAVRLVAQPLPIASDRARRMIRSARTGGRCGP